MDIISFIAGGITTLIALIAIAMIVSWLIETRRCPNCGEIHNKKKHRWKERVK